MRTRFMTAALGAAATGLYALVVRPRMLRAGARPEEAEGPFPGRELIPGGTRTGTMAITIDAPASEVWPWLVQMGCDRAGWYSWDRLDNGGKPSAFTIHPEWQFIEVGQRLAATPGGRAWFEVAAVEPLRFLALRAAYDGRGRPFDPKGPRPEAFTDSLWAFQLVELPGARTRVIVSGYAAGRPRWLVALTNFVFWEPAHFVMQSRQLENIKRRAEGHRALRTLSPKTESRPHAVS